MAEATVWTRARVQPICLTLEGHNPSLSKP